MAARKRAGVPGHETPRSKDLPRSVKNGPKGDVKKADRAAKRAVRRALASWLQSQGASAEEVSRLVRHYAALVRGLPSDSVSVRSLVSARVRNEFTAETLATQARAIGTNTPAGAKLLEGSHKADMHVQRFSLNCRDVAFREANIPLEGGGTTNVDVQLVGLDELLEAKAAADANERPAPEPPARPTWRPLSTEPIADPDAITVEGVEVIEEPAPPPPAPSPAPKPKALPPKSWQEKESENWARFTARGGVEVETPRVASSWLEARRR